MLLLIALICLLGASQRRKNQEPKSQVAPLPPQPPMALKAETSTLDFHLSPLLKTGGLAIQIRKSLNDLIRDTKGETIVKLRAFVAGAGDARRVQAEVTQLFSDRKLPLPVLTVMRVGGLGEEPAKVVIEAIVSTHHNENPNGLAFFAGQAGATLADALNQLKTSAQNANIQPTQIVSTTCFTSRLEGFEAVRSGIQSTFSNAKVNLVQAVRDPANDSSICEAIGQLPQHTAESPLTLLKDHRVALVTSKELIITGLQLSFGSYLDDAHEAFLRLQRSATALNSVEAPVEINVFSLDPSGGSALRKTTSVPPSTFTVQTVEGLPSVDATAGIEAFMAPDVSQPAVK
jgi:enamine deaminase RidA (YjgF/YER057c/UK114 family)